MPPKAKAKGGLTAKRKRLDAALAEETAQASGASSHGGPARVGGPALCGLLIYFWSWGFLSLPMAQKVAHAACTDFATAGAAPHQDLVNLSRMGNSGALPNNMHRDLFRHLEEPLLSPPCRVQLPIKVAPNTV